MTLLMALQNAVPADTVVMVPARDAVDLIFAVAAGCVAATFFAILIFLVAVLLQVRKVGKSLEALRHKVSMDPGVESLRKTAANVEAISDSLRGEVSRLSTSFSQLSDRMTQASDRMEERIEDFNALLEVVQGEAEEAFIEGAAKARGIRAGFQKLSAGERPRRARHSRNDGDRPFQGRPVDAHPGDPGLGDETPAGEEIES
jgi:hypothetical protein